MKTRTLRPAFAEVTRLAPDVPPVQTLLGWIEADAKVTPLKTLQGLIWAEGYARGDLRSEVFPDVLPALRAWRGSGVRLYVYSSGSEAAQKQLFSHLPEGDVTVLFSGFFDTTIGAKREAGSYRTIATAIGLPAGDLLFLSDVGAELDAAAASGWQTCQLVRRRMARSRRRAIGRRAISTGSRPGLGFEGKNVFL